MHKLLMLSAVALILMSDVFAQQTDFTGSWKINKEKVEWGQAPEYVLPVSFSITQTNKKITITRTVLDNHDSLHTYTEPLPFKGDTVTTPTYDGYKRAACVTQNKNDQLLALYVRSMQKDGSLSGNITETLSLDDEGKTLRMQRDVRQADGFTYSITGYYDKR